MGANARNDKKVWPGFFVTFEGIEGSGKSTQIVKLVTTLKQKGHTVLSTREPGGTPIGDAIRKILLDPESAQMTPVTEVLLYAAARAQHVAQVIGPALLAGMIVLCDRYFDATTAYQGAARKLDLKFLDMLHKKATDHLTPNLTILLDLEASKGLARAKGRAMQKPSLSGEGRFENENLSFHEQVRQGYLQIAKQEPDRVKIFDATLDPETLHKQITETVLKNIDTSTRKHINT